MKPPPLPLVVFAALILVLYFLSPARAIKRIHTVLQPESRSLVEAVDGLCGGALSCLPPPPPPQQLEEDVHPPPSPSASLAARSFPPPPPPPTPSPINTPGCDPSTGECTVEALVRRHAVQNTVVVTFGNMRQAHLTENWVYHLQRVGVGGLLVGMMNMSPEQPRYVALASKLRALGVGVYCVNSPQVRRQPQGGRWFHVLPLLRTGARVLLSDSDVVWMRDPRPYLATLEALHPKLDFTVSSDAQGGTDGRRLGDATMGGRGGRDRGPGGRRRRRWRSAGGGAEAAAADGGFSVHADPNDLDVENFGQCWVSMNIGIMHFPPGARPGTLASMEQAVTHLSEDNNLGRVDQGPINYRWKHGAGKWKWPQELYAVGKKRQPIFKNYKTFINQINQS